MPEIEQRPGVGVDGRGGPVIDPTKNVLDLVQALKEMLAELRASDNKYQDGMRDAETRRVDQLAALRVHYETIIEGMRTNSLKLLAEQLKEHKAEAGSRTSLLEQFRWESGGKFSGANTLWALLVGVVGVVIALAIYLKP
jgi:hypothetical protein